MKYATTQKKVELDADIIAKFSPCLRDKIKTKYAKLCKKDLRAAYQWLIDLNDASVCAFELDCDDADLIVLSDDLAKRARVLMGEDATRGGISRAFTLYEYLQDLCLEYAVRYPVEHSHEQIRARLCDAGWWLRGLRVSHKKFVEGVALKAGLISKHADIYCSDEILEKRASQHARNAKTLAGVKMANVATGEVMTLAEIASASIGSHENRRAELLTRVRGFEELAKKYKHAAEFVTVTCPSRMHAVLSNGTHNPRFDGTTPSQAQDYLVKAWARTRAQFARDGVKVYGLRIAEPHHDATPHWHMILFYRKDEKLKRLMRTAFAGNYVYNAEFDLMTLDEQAARIKNGVKFVSINPLKGSAAGYVLKYVLKNIGGLEGETSDEAIQKNSESLYPRVEAWAACWRIRQFQQIGGHYVSVWRELRRVDECKLEGKRPAFVNTWRACQKVGDVKADFALFIEGMGGLETKPREGIYKVDYDLIMGLGKYGKVVLTKVLGVGERFGSDVVATNRGEWVVV